MEVLRNFGSGGWFNGSIPELRQQREIQWKHSGIAATEEDSVEAFRERRP